MKYLTIILFLSITYSQEKYNGQFRGHPCDDTEYRDDYGSPNWKNYGGWLSECDSLASAYSDSTFAIVLEKRHSKKLEEERKRQEEIDNIDTDMDAMWENTIWNEIVEIGETIEYEVENITTVAGVRGAEAEDEALHHLYYRRSMRGISQQEYKKVYGKLKNKRDELFKKDKNNPKLEEMDNYLSHIRKKIKV